VLEERAPVRRVDETYRGDGVGDRHLVGRLSLVVVLGEQVQWSPGDGRRALDPVSDGRDVALLVGDTLGQAHGERGRRPPQRLRHRVQKFGDLVRAFLHGAEEPVGPSLRRLLREEGLVYSRGQPAKVLDERDPEHDRDRPDLADRERRDLLVRHDEAEKVVRLDARVGVRHERQGQLVDTRVSLERALCQARELGSVADRQVR
jgi:hypothetical protein